MCLLTSTEGNGDGLLMQVERTETSFKCPWTSIFKVDIR